MSFISEAERSYGCVPKPVLAKMDSPMKTRYTIQNGPILVSNADSQYAKSCN